MKRKAFAAAALAALGLVLAAVACGQNLQSTDVAQVRLAAPSGGQGADLGEPCPAHKQSAPATIRLESRGKKPLEITKFEPKNIPDRILFRGEKTDTECEYKGSAIGAPWNDSSGNCSTDQFCEGGSSPHYCYETSTPSTPVKVEQEGSVEFKFFMAAAEADGPEAELACPEPGETVPDEFRDDYCGHVRIETNAETENSVFNEGDTTIYLQMTSDRRGVLRLANNSLQFDGLEAGSTSDKKSFSVKNNSADAQLTISDITVNAQSQLVQVSPSQGPIHVDPGKSKEFDVQIDIPKGFDMEMLEGFDQINIESSAVNNCGSVPVNLTLNSTGSGGPAIHLGKDALSFKNSMVQDIEIANVGSEALVLQNMRVDPPGLASKYKFKYSQDSKFGDGSNIQRTLQAGKSVTLNVKFTASSGGVGKLKISHTDDSIGGESTVVLLGKKDAGYGQVSPPSAGFVFGEKQTFEFVVWNRGTSELKVAPIVKPPQNAGAPIGPSTIEVKGFSKASPIAAGDFATGTVTFDGSSGMQTTQMIVDMQADGANTSAIEIPVTVDEKPSGTNLKAKIKAFANNNTVKLGESARFDSSPSMGNSDVSGDFWYLLERPDKSTLFHTGQGREFTVRPDVAGTYKIGFSAVEGALQSQASVTLTAEKSSTN